MTTQERTSIRGVVEIVFYSGPAFTAGLLRRNEAQPVKFAGKVLVRENEAVRLEGRWVEHPKYGRQFEAEVLGHDLDLDAEGLAHFLANHPDVKGIGPAKAQAIAEAFGSRFDAAIRTTPEAIAAVAKVPLDTVVGLQRIWIANAEFNAAMSHLAAYGLTHHQVTTLVGKFGSQVVATMERDPYVLMASGIQSIAATQITGSISSDQIASITATKISGAISSNQIDSLAATKITGSITSAQIESIAASKITGSISSDQIASIAASKITGTISANQIGSINATSITGTIIANQIGAVNANVVVISQSVPFSNIWTSGSVTAVGSIYSDTGNLVASNGTLRGAGLHITGGGIYIDSPSSFRSAIGAAASPVAWAEVTGKPSVFPPDVHSHNYAPASHTHSVQVGLGMNKTWILDLNSNWYEVVSDVWVSSVTVT